MARLRAVDRDEVAIIGSLLALCVLIKILWLTPVDIYWDAGAKWHFVRQWSYSNDFSEAHWSHHMARFGVNVPTYFVQLLFGTDPRVYYVVPVASFTLQTLLVYLVARRLGGRGAGVFGALFMIFNTGMTRSASQLLPDGIVATAAIMAAYALVRFHEANGAARLRWLIGVGLGCALAYAIKESSVLLFPGFMAAVWLSQRRLKEAVIFGAVLATYAALETAGFRLFTRYAHRLAVVQEEHGYYPPIEFWDLFSRFRHLDPPFQMLFWLWVASTLYLLSSRDKRRLLLVPISFGFVLVLTFLVRQINPIIQWLSFKPRYMAPAAALFVVPVSLFVSDALGQAWQRWDQPRLAKIPELVRRHAGHCVLAVCALLGSATYRYERPWLKFHPAKELSRDADILNDAFRRNLPIIEYGRNPRALNTVYAIYLLPEYLAKSTLAKGGRLPNIQEGVRFTRYGQKHPYILRDSSVYLRQHMKKAVANGCAIVVTAKGRIRLSTDRNLPARCKAPRGKPLPA